MSGWWLPLNHRRLWTSLSFVLLAAVVFGSLKPHGLPPLVPVGDKWQHGLTYLVLATWFVGLAPRRTYPWIATGLVLLGFTMEILQYVLTTDRMADARDMTANSIGIAIGIVLAYFGLGAWAQRLESWLSRR
jgi:VanZ family protein